MEIDAVILGGGKIEDSLKSYTTYPSKAFIDIAGRPMVEYVIDALRKHPFIKRIVLALPTTEIPKTTKNKVDQIVTSGNDMLDTFFTGFEALGNRAQFILAQACDTPLIGGKPLENYFQKCERKSSNYGFYYPYLAKDVSTAKFPQVRHTYVRLKEGYFCGAGSVLLTENAVHGARETFNSITEARKNPMKIAKILGANILLKYTLGKLSVADLEAKLSSILSCPVAAVLCDYPEMAVNIDDENELLFVRQYLSKGRVG